MSKPIPRSHDSETQLPPVSKSAKSDQDKARVIGQFGRVLNVRDAHAFGPKSTFARWLDEFSEQGDEATSPPPMA